MKKIAISQSNYIPWKGYFDLINMVDDFILYDDMQYTRRDWRNRNRIKTPLGTKWITIPVEVKGKYFQKINETIVSDNNWSKNHWTQIKQNYSNSKYFAFYKEELESLYLNSNEIYLSKINYEFIKLICNFLDIETNIIFSSDFVLVDGKTDKLVDICSQLNANVYVSGPSAKNYLEEDKFCINNIEVEWINYNGYKEYNQLFSPFCHEVSILDLIFNEGSNSKKFMKSFEE